MTLWPCPLCKTLTADVYCGRCTKPKPARKYSSTPVPVLDEVGNDTGMVCYLAIDESN